jgi:hypothetical protein
VIEEAFIIVILDNKTHRLDLHFPLTLIRHSHPVLERLSIKLQQSLPSNLIYHISLFSYSYQLQFYTAFPEENMASLSKISNALESLIHNPQKCINSDQSKMVVVSYDDTVDSDMARRTS